jgi:hypothetical protein
MGVAPLIPEDENRGALIILDVCPDNRISNDFKKSEHSQRISPKIEAFILNSDS